MHHLCTVHSMSVVLRFAMESVLTSSSRSLSSFNSDLLMYSQAVDSRGYVYPRVAPHLRRSLVQTPIVFQDFPTDYQGHASVFALAHPLLFARLNVSKKKKKDSMV
ncbi:hypothetical protein [Phaffia rhodozyma]|uniref:Uncharacterized protein n=1 Tax=Phaffia rhodozyma TaxID=264483 RepID=A0A0F7SRZ5_PHARH|nr:hypothetical protein [Phaffia rhodozyma]